MIDTVDEFSFNGHSCVEFGLHYVPAAADRWFSSASWKHMEETMTDRVGAYYYGTTVGTREFKLECYFEEATIERLEAIERWLNRLTEGKLVFDDRPFVYYLVRPSAPSSGQTWAASYTAAMGLTGSGKCTLTFKAYMPYGILDRKSIDSMTDLYSADMVNRTGLILTDRMPALGTFSDRYQVYNPGTEFTYPTIRVAGSAPNGLTIKNVTTNETCTLSAFDLVNGGYLEINPEDGVRLQPDDTFAFAYHQDGYISLAPCIPYDRQVQVQYTEGSNLVTILNLTALNKEYVGRYIYLEGQWRKINYVYDDGRTVAIDGYMAADGIDSTDVVVMNEIDIIGTDLALTQLEFDYTPYVR